MLDRPTVIVAGLGRCGTSLTMQMLDAGGYPVAGQWPAYEDMDPGALLRLYDPALYEGRAVKIINPWLWRATIRDAVVLYCTRGPEEQAKSQIKFASLMAGMQPDLSPARVRAMRKVLRRDDRRARAWLVQRAIAWMDVPFEDTINQPLAAAAGLAAFLGGDFDVQAMARAVRFRSARCHPTLFEATLLENVA